MKTCRNKSPFEEALELIEFYASKENWVQAKVNGGIINVSTDKFATISESDQFQEGEKIRGGKKALEFLEKYKHNRDTI